MLCIPTLISFFGGWGGRGMAKSHLEISGLHKSQQVSQQWVSKTNILCKFCLYFFKKGEGYIQLLLNWFDDVEVIILMNTPQRRREQPNLSPAILACVTQDKGEWRGNQNSWG